MKPTKVMVSVWWDVNGVILNELLAVNTTINAEVYCEQLHRLRNALIEKRPALCFQHDSARPATVSITKELLRECDSEIPGVT